MKLESGKRVYVPSTKTFGTIVRTGGVLGLSASYAIVDDVGKRSVFVGKNVDFVYVDSSQKPGGEDVEIPPDVVPQLPTKYSPTECKKMTVDLYKTDLHEREDAYRTLMTKIETTESNATKSKTTRKTSSKKTSSKKKSKTPTEDKRPATRKRARV